MQNNHHDYARILAELIRFETVSDHSNLDLIDYIIGLLHRIPNKHQVIYNQAKTKANLWVQIGPDGNDGILLAGHTDVVPVVGQNWSQDPFTSYVQDGKIYGRGSCDMKGFIALVLDVMLSVDVNQLKHPIYLLFTYDEEVGCIGAKDIKDWLATVASNVAFAIIGEPTNLELVTAHKSIQAHITRFKGIPAHSSCPHLGKSAILSAAGFLQQLHTVLPTEQDKHFQPPFSTYNPGTISGGNALNIIPEHCEIAWECRLLPHFEDESIINRVNTLLKQIVDDTGVHATDEMVSFVPGLMDKHSKAIVNWLSPILPKNTPVSTVSFATEAGIFQQAGIPTIVYGPGHINQAHQPDEYVRVSAMLTYRDILVKICQKLFIPNQLQNE